MTTINLRIKDPDRTFFFIGKEIISSDSYVEVDTVAYNKSRKWNILTGIGSNEVESDVSLEEVREILQLDS